MLCFVPSIPQACVCFVIHSPSEVHTYAVTWTVHVHTFSYTVYCIVSRDRQSILNSLRQVVFGGLQGMQGKLWASRDSYSHQSLQLAAEHV